MSLNKFTDINQVKQWMNINCKDIVCDTLTSDNIIFDEAKVNELTVGALEYPSLDVVEEFSSIQTDNAGVLSLRQQLPALSHSTSQSTATGGILPLPIYPAFVEPDTDRTAGDEKVDFVTFHPKGFTINKTGLYRLNGYLFGAIAQATNATYCTMLVDGLNSPLTDVDAHSSSGSNTNNTWHISTHAQLTAGQRISLALSNANAANTAVVGQWKITCEFIR